MSQAHREHGVEHAQWDEQMKALGFFWDDRIACYMPVGEKGKVLIPQVLGGFDYTSSDSRAQDIGLWIARVIDGVDPRIWSDPTHPRFADPVTAAQYLLIEASNRGQ